MARTVAIKERKPRSVKTFGEQVFEQRRAMELKEWQLADIAKVNRNTIVNIETGRTPSPGIEIAKRLARALKCRIVDENDTLGLEKLSAAEIRKLGL